VLSRKPGEVVRLFNGSDHPIVLKPGEEIASVEVSRVAGDKVRLAFDAPSEIKILRKEIDDADAQITHPLAGRTATEQS
jgi:carbon storage regulator CsrA